jgi:hypothetical protein
MDGQRPPNWPWPYRPGDGSAGRGRRGRGRSSMLARRSPVSPIQACVSSGGSGVAGVTPDTDGGFLFSPHG